MEEVGFLQKDKLGFLSLSLPSLLPVFCHGIPWKESPAQTGHGCWASRSTELLGMHLFFFLSIQAVILCPSNMK